MVDSNNGTAKDDIKLYTANASFMGDIGLFGNNNQQGSFYFPYGNDVNSSLGLTPEKLVVPRNYHTVLKMCYDFYQRGGVIGTVMNRLSEFTITEVRNGQRNTSDEANVYFDSVLHDKPSRLMRFLRTAALEFYLSGMVLPKVDWEELPGSEIHPDLKATKKYWMPTFDLYPPQLIEITWASWGKKQFWLKLPNKTLNLIKNKGGRIKEQQLQFAAWQENYPTFVTLITGGADRIEITDSDPILRKELSFSQYPTPYLFPVLEPLIFKQQLRRMDFAVASRVINAVLLVQEGDKDFPLTEDNSGNLDKLREQIQARSGNPALMERIFILFSNHTTKMTWITPDVSAMLNQDKYRQVNEELEQGLGMPITLLTGQSTQQRAAEVSTWSIQPQMEEFRSMAMEWASDLYYQASKKNNFRQVPYPQFKPIKLQDFVKTAAVFAGLFAEGNVSRTTRTDMAGIDFETEVELMKDEQTIASELPAFVPTPYSPAPPMIGGGAAPGKPGRPVGSQNVPVNNRNSGVKPKGQKPLSSVKASVDLMSDEDVLDLLDAVAAERGLIISPEILIDKD